MSFSIVGFTRTNKVVMIWIAFAALLYLFRDLFGLVFITYLLCFITHSFIQPLHRRFGWNRRLMVVLMYALYVLLIGWMVFVLIPTLISEARSFGDQLPAAIKTVASWAEAQAADSPALASALQRVKEYLTPEQLLLRAWSIARSLLERGVQYISWFLLGFVFSFLILFDLPRLMKSIRALRGTRLAVVYEETADSVVLFARVVGENFRAQLQIATATTLLTAAGLLILGVNGVILLCTMVFIGSLVPVLGIIIASAPIFLMAVNSGGTTLGLWSLFMVGLVHIIEAYYLSPRILASVMSINPVVTLIILYLAYSLIGIWGMLLGVPVAVYLYRQVIVGPGPDTRTKAPAPLPTDGASPRKEAGPEGHNAGPGAV